MEILKRVTAIVAMAIAVAILANVTSAEIYSDKPFDPMGMTTEEIINQSGAEGLSGIYAYQSMEDFLEDFESNPRYKEMESSQDDDQKMLYKNYANIYLYFPMPLGYETEDILEVKFDEEVFRPGLRVEVIFKDRKFLTYAYDADGNECCPLILYPGDSTEPANYILFDVPIRFKDYRDVGKAALDEWYCGSGFRPSGTMIPMPMEKAAASDTSEIIR